jgi:hypothetical protein
LKRILRDSLGSLAVVVGLPSPCGYQDLGEIKAIQAALMGEMGLTRLRFPVSPHDHTTGLDYVLVRFTEEDASWLLFSPHCGCQKGVVTYDEHTGLWCCPVDGSLYDGEGHGVEHSVGLALQRLAWRIDQGHLYVDLSGAEMTKWPP